MKTNEVTIYCEKHNEPVLVQKVAESLEAQYGDNTYPDIVVSYAKRLIRIIRRFDKKGD